MSGGRKRDRLIARARDMYACGLMKAEIGQTLGVSANTVGNWCAYDRGRGIDWDKERELMHTARHEEVHKRLWDRFSGLVLEAGIAQSPQGEDRRDHEARLMLLIKLMKGTLEVGADLSSLLRGLERFADYCYVELPTEDLDAVRRAIASFIERLREETR